MGDGRDIVAVGGQVPSGVPDVFVGDAVGPVVGILGIVGSYAGVSLFIKVVLMFQAFLVLPGSRGN